MADPAIRTWVDQEIAAAHRGGSGQPNGGSGGDSNGPSQAREFPVMNASGGIYWRSAPDWNTAERIAGNGVYPGTVIAVSCYESGAANVPGSRDSMWEQASWVSGPGRGHGWINEHFINDRSALNQPSPGVPPCSNSSGGTGGTGGGTGGTGGGTGGTGGGTGGTGGGTTTGAWSGPLAVPTSGAVSCASATFCVATDSSGRATIFNGASWSTPTQVATTGGDASANPVSCVSTSFCVLVDFRGDAYIYDGASWGTATTVFDSPTGNSAVSCASSTFCVAVDNGAAATYNGSSWSAPVNIDGTNQLYGVSCSSATLCVAVDQSKQALAYNGNSWSSPTTIVTSPTPSVSCAGVSFCAVVGDTNAVTFNGETWSGPTNIGSLAFPSVSCASASFCIVADGAGKVFNYNGSSWSSPTQLVPFGTGQMWASCAPSSFCAVVVAGESYFYRP